MTLPMSELPMDYRTRAFARDRHWQQEAARAALPPQLRPLTPSSQVGFAAGPLAPALALRGEPADASAIARRDLRRYYWLLGVALDSAPPIAPGTWERLLQRAGAALAEPTSAGDLTATVYAAVDLLPIGTTHGARGWTAIQLLALADVMEHTARRCGVEGLRALGRPASGRFRGRVKVTAPPPPRGHAK